MSMAVRKKSLNVDNFMVSRDNGRLPPPLSLSLCLAHALDRQWVSFVFWFLHELDFGLAECINKY